MTSEMTGILVGGVLPALIFGLGALAQKLSGREGIGLGSYLISISVAVFVVGLIFFALTPETATSWQARGWSALFGTSYALGVGCIAIALTRYGAPLSKLAPLYNMNALVTVLLGLWIFSEWQQVKLLQLIVGTILIAIGGVLASLA